MSILNELVSQIEDVNLRTRIAQEVEKLAKQKKFGLVFEEHLPECTPLYDMPIRVGSRVAKKDVKITDIYNVISINNGIAMCVNKDTKETTEFPVDDLVIVAEFGEPIYPYLKPLDSVCNAPDSDLWHALIEADNYHALQLLEYLYAGKVDCIYIDPPYNTGAKDWKYNNDYVDGVDQYRHSKWLSMMQKRLKIAKKLLNPKDSVLIVTIDEKEYLHLGCLLEEMFPEANIQMISSEISRKGAVRYNQFTRTNEFIYFVMIGSYNILPTVEVEYTAAGEPVHWQPLRRSSIKNVRNSRPRQFYPIYVDVETNRIVKIGEYISYEVDRFSVPQIDGCVAVFPVRDDGTEMLWGVTPNSCQELFEKGYLQASSYNKDKPQQFIIKYLMGGTVADIEAGKIKITGKNPDGSIIAENVESRKTAPRTQWAFDTHDAMDYGTRILKNIFAGLRFDFPKSLYAVHDSIRLFIANKPNALIVDFFAGSGTTLHAVNLLNAADGGKRRCILVTNNEVSVDECKSLTEQGYKPGDIEWNNLGIARYVTWPRTVCSIQGEDVKGAPLKGNYLGIDKPMADGFKANAAFFQLGFLDKNAVALGRQFKELLPVLWMKAGAKGECPSIKGELPKYLILEKNKFAVLINEQAYLEFVEALNDAHDIETVFIVTDSETGYRSMIANINVENTYQLYRDYLDNFRINSVRR